MTFILRSVWLACTAFGCRPDVTAARQAADSGTTPPSWVDASFAQGEACDETPPDTYKPVAPGGPWPIQIGIPKGRAPFTLFGAGCQIPVAGTFQGNQFARLALRFPEMKSPLVFARFTVTSLENRDAGVVRDVNFNVEQLGLCRPDGYCYISPVLANIVALAPVQGELRNHEVQISVRLSEVNNEQRFGHTTTWGRLQFPDEAPPDAGSGGSR